MGHNERLRIANLRSSIMTQPVGPQTAAGQATLAFKYAQSGEDWRAVSNRVAETLSDSDAMYHSFRDIISDMRFIPGGRILAGAGTTKRVTMANCFVSGTIEDSLKGIMTRLSEAAETLRMGGGIGYDFSTIRPNGDIVRSLNSRASGPVSYINLYDAMGATIASSGERRGAQMGILRVDHPDIEAFIYAKHNQDRLRRFNLSVAITDQFVDAVRSGSSFPLVFEGRVYREIDPRALWELIMRSTWDWAEPGVVFIDRMNYWNNLSYCETIAATNPCSEQPLPPYGACILGSFNLARYLVPVFKVDRRYEFNWMLFADDIKVAVKAMDRVFDISYWPLEEQRAEALAKRRMGLGVMGLANCLEALECPYGSPEAIEMTNRILEVLKNEAYFMSACLADQRGKFPAYQDTMLSQPFIQTLSPAVQGRIAQSGLRNSHLITMAPTGTTAFLADNVSSGIEPVFSTSEVRNVETPEGVKQMHVEDYGAKFLRVVPKTADQVTVAEHVAMLCAVQRHVDSAVSKTCNVPSDMPWDGFKEVYMTAFDGGAKGCSTFQIAGKRSAIRQAVTDCQGESCAA